MTKFIKNLALLTQQIREQQRLGENAVIELREQTASFAGVANRSQGNAYRHLGHGVLRRLFIVRRSIEVIVSLKLPTRKTQLSREDLADLNVHLNSFYFHLRGMLDNLAWGIAYRSTLFGELNETNGSDQRKIGLFLPSYLHALEVHMPDVVQVIQSHQEWSNELKVIRDPVAHRIPLYAVPSFLTKSDSEKLTALIDESFAAIAAGDTEKSERLLSESDRVGKYMPFFHSDGAQSLYPILGRILHDLQKFQEILAAVTNALGE